jgi:hypothetical protein
MGKFQEFRKKKGIKETVKRHATKLWSRVRYNPIPVRVMFMRHGEKARDETDDPPLTTKGRAESEDAGRQSPENRKLKIHHSDMKRTRETGKHYAIGAQEQRVTRYPESRQRDQLGFYWGVVEKALEDKKGHTISKRELETYVTERKASYLELYTTIGEPEFTKRWIAGDAEILKVLPPASDVADELIWQSRLGKRLDERAAKAIDIGKFTHAGLSEVMALRLTGKHFATETIPKNQTLRYNESVILEFKRGKVWLKFRNIRADVTKRYNEIITKRKKNRK